jgi:hypothetical protein
VGYTGGGGRCAMKPWMYFVLGGFVGLIGYNLAIYFMSFDLTIFQMFQRYSFVIYHIKKILKPITDFWGIAILVWSISGFIALHASNWGTQRSRLKISLLRALIVGTISGVFFFFVYVAWLAICCH